jgi:hypothetical protein
MSMYTHVTLILLETESKMANVHYKYFTLHTASGPGNSVGIATGYGLDSPGIESQWGRDFSHTSRPALGLTQPPVHTIGNGSFPGVEQPGRGADHPPPPSAEVENEQRYNSTPPLGPRWPVIG